MKKFQDLDISTLLGTLTINMLSFYKNQFCEKPNDFLIFKSCDENAMELPLHNKIAPEDCEYVAKATKDF